MRISLKNGPRRGIAATELAIVLPFLIVVCLLSMDIGRAIHSYLCLSNSARVGAERGATLRRSTITQNDWLAQVENAMQAEMSNAPRFDPAKFSTNVTTTVDSRNLLQVDVAASYQFHTLIDWPGWDNPITLRHRLVMRQFR